MSGTFSPDVRLEGEEPPTATSAGVDEPSGSGRGHGQRRRRKTIAVLLALLAGASVGAVVLQLTGQSGDGLLPSIGDRSRLPRYVFSMYGVTRPLGVAVSRSGERIYVTESDGTRLTRIFDRSGKQLGTLPPPKGSRAAHLPVYVAVDPVSDEVYVSDRPRQAVFVYDGVGRYRRQFVPSEHSLGGGWQPLGLAFAADGGLYVTDVSGPVQRVLALRRDGGLIRSFDTAGRFAFPNGLALDRRGNLYVTDSNHGRLVVFDRAGKLVAVVSRGLGAGDFGLPRGLAIDDRNRLYVVDTTGHTVQVYQLRDDGPPAYVGALGEEGQEEAAFAFPNGIAIDGSRVYVTDRENNRLQVWEY